VSFPDGSWDLYTGLRIRILLFSSVAFQMLTKNKFSSVPVLGSRIRDPGWVKIRIRDQGSGINIPDPQHWFSYLLFTVGTFT
jgi:hypothetical protein